MNVSVNSDAYYSSDYGFSATAYDDLYKKNGIVKNPLGVESDSYHIIKGGCYESYTYTCCVTYRDYCPSKNTGKVKTGIRLVRSIEGAPVKVSDLY